MSWNSDPREAEATPAFAHEPMTLESAELVHDGWPEAFERRDRGRLGLVEPIELEWGGARQEAELRNHSDRGVYLVCEAELRPGQKLVLVRGDARTEAEVVHHRPVARSLIGLGRPGAGLRLL